MKSETLPPWDKQLACVSSWGGGSARGPAAALGLVGLEARPPGCAQGQAAREAREENHSKRWGVEVRAKQECLR